MMPVRLEPAALELAKCGNGTYVDREGSDEPVYYR